MATDPGYGYFRPTINLFDPGWRLTPDGHDLGTHPGGVMDRSTLFFPSCASESNLRNTYIIVVYCVPMFEM